MRSEVDTHLHSLVQVKSIAERREMGERKDGDESLNHCVGYYLSHYP
jgi:hypothetical protein